jgi:hypothetical protein
MTRLTSILLTVVVLAFTVSAQQEKPLAVLPDQPVPNDDRGQAFILKSDLPPLSSFSHLRKAGISEPQQYSIFLGEGWANSTLHAREEQLQSLLANVSNDADLSAIEASGIKNRFGPTASFERLDVTPGPLTDLDAQRTLATMLGEGGLPRPNPKAIYVIFLDANQQSSLGSLVAGKHYAAYHSVFIASGARIRYVVVPFASDPAASYQIALRAFVAAAVKSTHSTAK